MGIYPRLERAIPGVDPLAVDGKGLAVEFFQSLETEGAASPYAPLGDMFSTDPEEAAAFAAAEGIEVAPPQAVWHDADKGVQAVREVLQHMRRRNPVSRAIADMEQIESILAAAAEAGVRFYLTCDMP